MSFSRVGFEEAAKVARGLRPRVALDPRGCRFFTCGHFSSKAVFPRG